MADATFHSRHHARTRMGDAFVAVALSLLLAALVVVAAQGTAPEATQPDWHGNSGTGLIIEGQATAE